MERDGLAALHRLYGLLAEFLYLRDGRGDLEGGCAASVCRFVYARSIMARMLVEKRPVLDAAALLAAYGISPVLTADHALTIRELVAAAVEAPEGLRSTSIFTAVASLPGLGLLAATLPLFLLEPRRYPLYDEEYARGLRLLLHAARGETGPPTYEELRAAARARNQPLLSSLYREASRAHMEALRRYAFLLELAGYPASSGLLPGLALDALARLAARGRLAEEEVEAALAAAGEVRSLHRAARFVAGPLAGDRCEKG